MHNQIELNGKQFKLKYGGNFNRSTKRQNLEFSNRESVQIGSVASQWDYIVDDFESWRFLKKKILWMWSTVKSSQENCSLKTLMSPHFTWLNLFRFPCWITWISLYLQPLLNLLHFLSFFPINSNVIFYFHLLNNWLSNHNIRVWQVNWCQLARVISIYAVSWYFTKRPKLCVSKY